MPAFTLRYRNIPSDAEAGNVEAVVRAFGGRIVWQRNDPPFSTYALVERVERECAAALARDGVEVEDGPVIAVAISPQVPEAMPFLEDALAGAGAPSSVRRCEPVGAGLVLEWELDRPGSTAVIPLADLEIARVGGGRITRLLSPLPLEWCARIASEGLQTPGLTDGRVLEELLEVHRVAD